MSSTKKQADLNITDMSCSGCANTVKEALAQLDGVESASANHEENSASVVYDAGKVTVGDFEKAVESAGYTFGGIN